jgi:hypothetical protein
MPSLSHQWTIKSKRFDKELVTGCRLAAEKQGMAMGDWCVETLRERAQAILKGDEAPAHPPPARLEDVADVLSARLALAEQRMAETVERLVPPPSVPAREARRLRMALRRR